MVSTAWVYSIQFKFWSPQLHQHLRLYSTWHINNETYPLIPHLYWHQYLHLCILYRLLDSCNLYKQRSSSLCTCYPCTHFWWCHHAVSWPHTPMIDFRHADKCCYSAATYSKLEPFWASAAAVSFHASVDFYPGLDRHQICWLAYPVAWFIPDGLVWFHTRSIRQCTCMTDEVIISVVLLMRPRWLLYRHWRWRRSSTINNLYIYLCFFILLQ